MFYDTQFMLLTVFNVTTNMRMLVFVLLFEITERIHANKKRRQLQIVIKSFELIPFLEE